MNITVHGGCILFLSSFFYSKGCVFRQAARALYDRLLQCFCKVMRHIWWERSELLMSLNVVPQPINYIYHTLLPKKNELFH